MYPTISFPSSWDPAQPSTPSSSHRLWYRLFRVWYDHPLKVGHHSLCSFLNRRAIPHSTGKAMGNKIRIAVRYLIGLFFTILMKRIIQWSELWFSLCFCGWGKTSLICVREWFIKCENGVSTLLRRAIRKRTVSHRIWLFSCYVHLNAFVLWERTTPIDPLSRMDIGID